MNDRFSIDSLAQYFPLSEQDLEGLYARVSTQGLEVVRCPKEGADLPLFRAYPELAKHIPYIRLTNLPTPLEQLSKLGVHLGHDDLYIKRDDMAGKLGEDGRPREMGGNKLRKIEFLLADALCRGYKSVLTFGAAGSNHVLTTAVYAHALGLDCYALMRPQESSAIVRRNLLMDAAYGCTLRLFESRDAMVAGIAPFMHEHKDRYGAYPYVISTGGTQPEGDIGFVNAAFELKEQIEQGAMRAPDYIFITHGSGGSYIGLELGLRAAGLRSKIIGVADEDKGDAAYEKTLRLFHKTNALLSAADPSFPTFSFDRSDLAISLDYVGAGYGKATPQALEAIRLLREYEGIELEQTYTAKTFSALIEWIEQGKLAGKTVLFWDTFCGFDFSHITAKVSPDDLPHEFQPYFEKN